MMAINNSNSEMLANSRPIDYPSLMNQFGWEKIAENFAVPVVVRKSGVRYSPVKIVEQEIIKKYDAIPQSVFACINIKSFYLTSAEAKLLNHINFNHCEGHYGEYFFNSRDVVIAANDVRELSRFLEVSRIIFADDHAQLDDKFGVISIVTNPMNPLNSRINVPFITKYIATQAQPLRFIPSKLVEAFVINVLSKSIPNDWDIMYLKMLSIYSDNSTANLQFITRDYPLMQREGLLYRQNNSPIIYEEFKQQQQQLNWQQQC